MALAPRWTQQGGQRKSKKIRSIKNGRGGRNCVDMEVRLRKDLPGLFFTENTWRSHGSQSEGKLCQADMLQNYPWAQTLPKTKASARTYKERSKIKHGVSTKQRISRSSWISACLRDSWRTGSSVYAWRPRRSLLLGLLVDVRSTTWVPVRRRVWMLVFHTSSRMAGQAELYFSLQGLEVRLEF